MSYHQFADTDPIRYHKEAIAALQKDVEEMNENRLRHIKEGVDGRLSVDDTENMLRVTKAQIEIHRECLALTQHYAGEPFLSLA